MPNLVGIGNSQVPTNAMLGGLAYQDSVGEIVIDKIKARTVDTATDIFVYDTRKDSDGGAWRHRTQKTSWYNEGASATRGARKEFPAVAVIVAEQNFITIYDGDDPNLPMWMVFNTIAGGNSQGMADRPMVQLQGVDKVVYMLNGILATGTKNSGSNYGQPVINFISEKVLRMDSEGGEGGEWMGNIAQRNDAIGYRHVTYDYVIVNSHVNDVAMTVLPNAPIDTSTGLPIPTIAVATENGISIITDSPDGVVYDLTTNNEADNVNEIAFLADNRYSFATTANNSRWWVDDIQTADENHNYFYQRTTYDYSQSGQANINHLGRVNGTCRGEHGEAIFRQASGLSRIRYIDRLLNFTTTDFNTGWMGTEVKGAFLSSTDDTNLSGTSLIANGDFSSSSTAAFTTVAGGTAAVVGGLLKLTDTGGVFCYASAPFTTVPGDQYFITADIVNSSNTANANYIRCGNSHNGTEFHNTNYGTGYGTKTFYFTATATTTYLTLISGNGVGEIGHWDNVFAYKLDNSRINNKGLKPYGTITKEPVATGAELVSYGPFTDSNYLKQPYNSDLNFGSDGFSLSIWIKPAANSPYMRIVNRVQDTNDRRWELYTDDTVNNIVFYIRDNAQASYVNVNDAIPLNTWTHIFAVREQNGDLKLYVNGVLAGTESLGSNANPAIRGLTSTTATLLVGNAVGWDNDNPFNGKLALLKISASMPSAEQIKKIYNDEKNLFNENAKCTLYGTSDSITAATYDDSNDVLHVGTSSGRSEFQGLVRINNTTTAVTTEISASNGLVAEQ